MANKQIPDLVANTNPSDAALYEVDDGGVSGKVLNTDIGQLRKVGTAIIGGDFTGNARGANAIDIQTFSGLNRGVEVASGDSAIALSAGQAYQVSGAYAIAIGGSALADNGIAIGGLVANGATLGVSIGASGSVHASLGMQIGYGGEVATGATQASAIGYDAYNNVPNTTNIAGVQIIAKDQSWGDGDFINGSGVEVIIMTPEIDLKVVADHTTAVPAGAHFWFSEVGIVVTQLTSLSVQPTIRFGDEVGAAHQLAAAITTDLDAVFNRQFFTSLDRKGGHTSLIFGVTVEATATILKGRAYFKGILVANQ